MNEEELFSVATPSVCVDECPADTRVVYIAKNDPSFRKLRSNESLLAEEAAKLPCQTLGETFARGPDFWEAHWMFIDTDFNEPPEYTDEAADEDEGGDLGYGPYLRWWLVIEIPLCNCTCGCMKPTTTRAVFCPDCEPRSCTPSAQAWQRLTARYPNDPDVAHLAKKALCQRLQEETEDDEDQEPRAWEAER